MILTVTGTCSGNAENKMAGMARDRVAMIEMRMLARIEFHHAAVIPLETQLSIWPMASTVSRLLRASTLFTRAYPFRHLLPDEIWLFHPLLRQRKPYLLLAENPFVRHSSLYFLLLRVSFMSP
jgi:hypothetical protein